MPTIAYGVLHFSDFAQSSAVALGALLTILFAGPLSAWDCEFEDGTQIMIAYNEGADTWGAIKTHKFSGVLGHTPVKEWGERMHIQFSRSFISAPMLEGNFWIVSIRVIPRPEINEFPALYTQHYLAPESLGADSLQGICQQELEK